MPLTRISSSICMTNGSPPRAANHIGRILVACPVMAAERLPSTILLPAERKPEMARLRGP
jgi:hypothetical protein